MKAKVGEIWKSRSGTVVYILEVCPKTVSYKAKVLAAKINIIRYIGEIVKPSIERCPEIWTKIDKSQHNKYLAKIL